MSNPLPIEVKDGVATINVVKSIKLTPRQNATLKHMEAYDRWAARQYLESLMGFVKSRVNVTRLTRGYNDRLASKQPGGILKQFRSLLANDEDTKHRPTQRNIGQWVGVEIECYIPYEDDEDGNRIDDTYYYYQNLRKALAKANVTRVSVKDDGSLADDDGTSVEVTMLFNTAHGFHNLEKLCGVLKSYGCYVNDKCGLHVHLDARHLKRGGVLRIGRRLGRALPILRYMVDESRTNDKSFNSLHVSPLINDSDERYCAVNLVSYFKYRTVEVRLHGGTTNFKKIRNWIETLQFLANKKMPKELKTFQDFIDTGIPTHLVEYADKRISSLNPGAWTILTPPTPVEVPVAPAIENPEVNNV